MPKIDEAIKKAICLAADQRGSQAKLAKDVGVTPAALSRYLKDVVKTINASTWNMLFPHIQEYLPEHYHRTFLGWKTPEAWKAFADEYPQFFQKMNIDIENVDMLEIAQTSPLFGRSPEFLATVQLLTAKLPHLTQDTLNHFLQEALEEIKRNGCSGEA